MNVLCGDKHGWMLDPWEIADIDGFERLDAQISVLGSKIDSET